MVTLSQSQKINSTLMDPRDLSFVPVKLLKGKHLRQIKSNWWSMRSKTRILLTVLMW